jgi:zinc transport system substrate-binding protein
MICPSIEQGAPQDRPAAGTPGDDDMMTRRLMLSTALAGMAMVQATAARAEVPVVVTDTPVVHALAAQVMGGLGAPVLLLDRGADPHNFQLRPSQARALSDAGLVFWTGAALAPWMARAIDGLAGGATVTALLDAEGVELRGFAHGHSHDDHSDDADDHDDHAHDDDHDHDHDHGEEDHAHDDHAHDDHAHDGIDPHAWLYPANARAWVAAIADGLSAADPTNAATYAANAAAAAAGITALEAELEQVLAPAAGVPVVVFHDAYGYLAHRYGLNVAGTIALGDAAAPGAARLADLRGQLAEGGIVCVFPEVNHSSRHVDMLVEGTEVRVGALLDPAGVAREPGPALYAETMRALARDIAACVTGG